MRFKAAIAVAMTAVLVGLYFVFPERVTHRFADPDGGDLTNAKAVHYTRLALAESGIASAEMRPVPFGFDSNSLFARNTLDPQAGYVLWWVESPEAQWEYMVHIKKIDGKVECVISEAK